MRQVVEIKGGGDRLIFKDLFNWTKHRLELGEKWLEKMNIIIKIINNTNNKGKERKDTIKHL